MPPGLDIIVMLEDCSTFWKQRFEIALIARGVYQTVHVLLVPPQRPPGQRFEGVDDRIGSLEAACP